MINTAIIQKVEAELSRLQLEKGAKVKLTWNHGEGDVTERCQFASIIFDRKTQNPKGVRFIFELSYPLPTDSFQRRERAIFGAVCVNPEDLERVGDNKYKTPNGFYMDGRSYSIFRDCLTPRGERSVA